jgi:hypothetical protein
MIALLLVLAACAPKTPPAVFAQPVPEPAAPQVIRPPDDLAADACLDTVPYLPGKPPPFVVDGLVRCRAQVVPEAAVIQCIRDSQLADYWEGLYGTCSTYRGFDRVHCENVAAGRWEHAQELRRELRVTKATAAVAGVAGFVLGAAIVAGIERVTR